MFVDAVPGHLVELGCQAGVFGWEVEADFVVFS